MPEAVADTSPLLHLDRIGRLELLRETFDRVALPAAVAGEIDEGMRNGLPGPDLAALPWIDVVRPDADVLFRMPRGLGLGEREVLALGSERTGSLVLLDDRVARREATALGLRVIGTLGILLHAKRAGRLERIGREIGRLEEAGFRLDPVTRSTVMRLAGERDEPSPG